MRNIELKARVEYLEAARQVALSLPARHFATLRQTDTYFACSTGRLKLREIRHLAPPPEASSAELIWYDRPNASGPKPSQYHLVAIADPSALRVMLEAGLGVESVVRKQREVFLLENIRIHLDRVERLGTFLEFEAVMDADRDDLAEEARLDRLAEQFSLTLGDRLTGSYNDLMQTLDR